MASSSQIKPGERGSIKVTVDVGNADGTLVKSVSVYSNDPKRPQVTLTIKAEIRRN
jgi:hypothetical protein